MKSVAIVGSGPAALMAATQIAAANIKVTVFEKKKKAGLKLLVAGASGLNVSNSINLEGFVQAYGGDALLWSKILNRFSPQDWLGFIQSLGIKTFEGTSGRFFVEGMKALKLLRTWREMLTSMNVDWRFEHELTGFKKSGPKSLILEFNQDQQIDCDAVCLCLGGASYEPEENPLRWPKIFKENNIEVKEFAPSNVGFQVNWSPEFLKEAEGQPLKNISLTSAKGTKRGDAMITRYGIEGTPIYFVGQDGVLTIDLKPDLSLEQILERLFSVKENLSPMRRAKKFLNLGPAALALLFHHAPKNTLQDTEVFAELIKKFPLTLGSPQPLNEAISSAGGLELKELDQNFMIKKFPGVFAAGEMLDWDAPTGGFLIQGCVSQGFIAGKGIVSYLNEQ